MNDKVKIIESIYSYKENTSFLSNSSEMTLNKATKLSFISKEIFSNLFNSDIILLSLFF